MDILRSIIIGLTIPLIGCNSSNEDDTVTYQMRGQDGNIYQIQGPPGKTRKEVEAKILERAPQAGIPQPMYLPPPSFHGYDCTYDCSGHEAGYAWAEEQGITDPDECGGNSLSFEEGCRAYAEEQ